MYRKPTAPLTYEKAKDKALNILSFRAHSEKELERKLHQGGANDEDIQRIIEFCREHNFINDESFACQLANYLVTQKKYGKHRIKDELKRRGVSQDIIYNALEELEVDEASALYPLMEKKLAGDFEKKSVDRAIRYFASHGYAVSDIYQCIDSLRNH